MTFFSNLCGQSKVYMLMYPFVKWIVIPTPQTDIRIKWIDMEYVKVLKLYLKYIEYSVNGTFWPLQKNLVYGHFE